MVLDPKIPAGDLKEKWQNYKDHCKLVSPANKRNIQIIVVGTGLAGASAAATLGELGYNVKSFVFRTARGGHTASRHREASTQPRIIKMTATQYSVSIMKH